MPAYVERFERCPVCNVRGSVRSLYNIEVCLARNENGWNVCSHSAVMCSDCIKYAVDQDGDFCIVDFDFDEDFCIKRK